MTSPLVSFIVPVLNAEPYLGQCLESLVDQDIAEVEVIVIDDGSTDGSADICKSMAEADARIRVLQGPRQGAGAARNKGLDVAAGEYVVFVDADDWVDADMASLVHGRRGYDIIFFGYREHRDGQVKDCRIKPYGDFSSDIDAALTRLFRSPERFFGFTWNKAFRRGIIEKHGLRFDPDLIIKEDEDFCVRFVGQIASLYLSDAMPYHYRILPGSLSHRKLRDRRLTLLAERIEADAAACPWPDLQAQLIAAAFEYHLDGFRDSSGASFSSWDAFSHRNRNRLPATFSRRLFALPWAYLRAAALRFVHLNSFAQRIKSSLKKLKP